jgi:serine/threonine protein phosphatase 1
MNLKKFEKNTTGTDYFVGDLHGCYDLFMDKLNEIGFDKTKDRMFSVGDLADRGAQSFECALLIDEPWFHAVRGNHEDMLIGVSNDQWPVHNFIMNGGQWAFDIPLNDRKYAVQLMQTLPRVMEVETEYGTIGILHADAVETTWKAYHEQVNMLHLNNSILWGRTRINSDSKKIVNDIDAVVVGHTPLKEVAVLGNVVYIDTGAVYGYALTVLSAEQVMKLVKEST